jgi:hypothetical protein
VKDRCQDKLKKSGYLKWKVQNAGHLRKMEGSFNRVASFASQICRNWADLEINVQNISFCLFVCFQKGKLFSNAEENNFFYIDSDLWKSVRLHKQGQREERSVVLCKSWDYYILFVCLFVCFLGFFCSFIHMCIHRVISSPSPSPPPFLSFRQVPFCPCD